MKRQCTYCSVDISNKHPRAIICGSRDCAKAYQRDYYSKHKKWKACKYCNSQFEGRYKETICDRCKSLVSKKRVASTPNVKVSIVCRRCGITKQTTQRKATRGQVSYSTTDGLLCGKCRKESRDKLSMARLGDKNPNWKGGKNPNKYNSYDEMRVAFSERMKKHNPMKDPAVVARMVSTKKKRSYNYPSGPNHHLWSGGNKPAASIRSALLIWTRIIKKRDRFSCRRCGQRGGDLEVHHIKKFAGVVKEMATKKLSEYDVSSKEFYDLRRSIVDYHIDHPEIGITYCANCHALVDPMRHVKELR